MSRTITDCPDDPNIQTGEQHPNTITKTYTITVITPIFGGGAETGVNDSVTPVRPSSIRGHLRFWWRATRGARFQSVRELRQREGEIWGTTNNPSVVTIQVQILEYSTPVECAVYEWNASKRQGKGGYDLKWKPPFESRESPLLYVLFPFQGGAPDSNTPRDPAKRVDSARFILTVQMAKPERMAILRSDFNTPREKLALPLLTAQDDDIQKDVEAAIWAWVNFGGIGARVRRGCGALYCRDYAPPSSDKIGTWLVGKRREFGIPDALPALSVPMIGSAPLIATRTQNPLKAWADAVDLLRQFRQEGVGRKIRPNPDKPMSPTNLPGRSYWPEPESLRHITKRRMLKHQRLVHIPEDAFPRAELGLPIVFHFQDERRGEPGDSELYPKDATRMASPIILRPLGVGDGSSAVAMVLRLAAPVLQELELKKVDNPPELNTAYIRRPDLAQYQNSPMGSPKPGEPLRSSNGSALDAFIAFTREKNFKEAKP